MTPLEAEHKTFGRHKGKLRTGDEYTVQKCGVGEEAKYAAENLIKEGADLLVGWGVGGSMTRQLNTGDLLISSSFKDQRGGFFEFQTDFAELLNATLSKLQPKKAAILTVEKMVLNQIEKAKLIEKTKHSCRHGVCNNCPNCEKAFVPIFACEQYAMNSKQKLGFWIKV